MPSAGERYRTKGYQANLPLLIVPGLCSSILKVEESPHEPWVGKRIWLNLSAIGMGKVWDFNNTLWGDTKKRKRAAQNQLTQNNGEEMRRSRANSSSNRMESQSAKDLSNSSGVEDDDDEETAPAMAEIDTGLKRRWIQHMILQEDGISDPPGIKLRVEKGLKGCAYLEPSNKALRMLSYVFGPFFEDLAELGYSNDNLRAAPYDWRVPPSILQQRDGYFDEVKATLEDMLKVNGKKTVILGHSLGTRCVQYFLNWAEKNHGKEWISKHVHSFVAVGPLFLGAPKAVRAMITGERMGMEAFLYPNEGLWLNRRIGSLPWMFPVRLEKDLLPLSKIRKGKNRYRDVDDKEILTSIYSPMWSIYADRYVADPLHGDAQDMCKPPPVDKLFAIYGINLDTEVFVCLKPSDKEGGELALDRTGKFPHYKLRGGLGYETSKTPQKCLGGGTRSGDGTVPYASLSYCRTWSETGMQVRIEELDLCDHRDILVDKRFKQLIFEYVCTCVASALPESFPDLRYEVLVIFGGRRNKCYMTITRRGIEVNSRGIGPVKIKVSYQQIQNLSINDDRTDVFRIDATGASRLKRLRSEKRREIVEEIASRCRYVDRMMTDDGDEEERDEFGQSPLHQAASENKVADVVRFLANGADVNIMDKSGWTPLHCASKRGHLDTVLCLLQNRDCNVNLVDSDQNTALQYLIQLKFPDNVEGMRKMHLLQQIYEMLGTRGANLEVSSKGGISPLHSAVMRGNEDAARFLLQHGAPINIISESGETPLHFAIKAEQKRCIQLLVEHHADKHVPNNSGVSPLNLAKSKPALFQLVCGVSAVSNEPPPKVDSATALHMALQKDRLDWVLAAAEKGRAEAINSRDRQGMTPLLFAASSGKLDVIAVLLQFPEADACSKTIDSETSALHYLGRYSPKEYEVNLYARMCKALVDRGLNVDDKNKTGESPLHYAILAGNSYAIAWLSENGCDLNAVNNKGETPLHYAVHARMMEMLKMLVNRGADINFKPKVEGVLTPAQLAEKVDASFASELQTAGKDSPTESQKKQKPPKINVRQSVFVALNKAQERRSRYLQDTQNAGGGLSGSANQRGGGLLKVSNNVPEIIVDDADEEKEDEDEADDEEDGPVVVAPTLTVSRQRGNRRTVVFSRILKKSPLSQSGSLLWNDEDDLKPNKEVKSPRDSPSSSSSSLSSSLNSSTSSVRSTSTKILKPVIKKETPPKVTQTPPPPAIVVQESKVEEQENAGDNHRKSLVSREKQWENAMYALKRVLHDGPDVEGVSADCLVRVTMNAKGEVKNIQASPAATASHYSSAFNDANTKLQNAVRRRQQRALQNLADKDIVDNIAGALGLTE